MLTRDTTLLPTSSQSENLAHADPLPFITPFLTWFLTVLCWNSVGSSRIFKVLATPVSLHGSAINLLLLQTVAFLCVYPHCASGSQCLALTSFASQPKSLSLWQVNPGHCSCPFPELPAATRAHFSSGIWEGPSATTADRPPHEAVWKWETSWALVHISCPWGCVAPAAASVVTSILESKFSSVQFSQSLSRVWLFATLWIAARQASLSITNSRSLLRLMSIELVIPSSHLIFCHPLLLLPPIPPNIRVFSNESTLCMRWPKYWCFRVIATLSRKQTHSEGKCI